MTISGLSLWGHASERVWGMQLWLYSGCLGSDLCDTGMVPLCSPPTHLAFNIPAFGSQLVNLPFGNIGSFFRLFQLVLGLAASREIDVCLLFLEVRQHCHKWNHPVATDTCGCATVTPPALPVLCTFISGTIHATTTRGAEQLPHAVPNGKIGLCGSKSATVLG